MRAVEEQTVLITGATDGLGRALAHALASRAATVLLHGRDPARLVQMQRDIRAASGNDRVRSYRAELAVLAAVRHLAMQVERDHDRLDLLINNAGIGAGRPGAPRELSADGYELRFAINYLAPFLLTNLLVPLLQRSAPARVVNVASAGQAPVDFDDVMLERGYDGMHAYRQSKLALILFTFELAERLRAAGAGVTVNALHPATLMDTKMVREWFGYARSSVEEGVEATLQLAIAAELDGTSGLYFDGLREARAHPQAYDPAARRRLWRLSEAYTAAVP
ncbi:MAG: SDR family NAD(P)-dependent oxidoreductase [Gammaproteobacteria bacterium]|jgi:NAD(P)-dependent dehydrogenase (short-subunit alcohol dehydrogenase family)